jgi:hypothetical protein
MLTTTELTVEFAENPAILGKLADGAATRLAIIDFSTYSQLRHIQPLPSRRPVPALYDGPNEAKRLVFEMVNQEQKILYQKTILQYEKDKQQNHLLNLYPGNMAGYGTYLIENHPQVLAFFRKRRNFPINEVSRRLHTYITGGSGSGKSECLKSFVWHYLTVDTSSALIFIDPHNDVAKQVAKFQPNLSNNRLVYIEPRINDKVFPGLNPFDIDDKEKLSDIEAEIYADEFIRTFHEILSGNLSDQMETLLRNTIPVLIKMPGTSVYDLIKFLKPRTKESKAQRSANAGAVKTPEYAAEKYLNFAKSHFKNAEMLDFLCGQFEDDVGYIATRNSLTTRLIGIFGGTLMQGLFRGKRTVRFEDLIPQRKLVVFNLAGLGRETGTIGRFVLITLKIFALNQAKVPESKRSPCHVFVDECQKFVTESMADILQEARKFYIFLTLAQQSAGAKMTPSIFDSVRTNTAIKIAGVNSGTSLEIMSKEIGIPPETIAGFRAGQFAFFQREASPKLAVVRMPTNTLRNSASMHALDWQGLIKDQIQLYYRIPAIEEPMVEKSAQASAGFDPLNTNINAHLN